MFMRVLSGIALLALSAAAVATEAQVGGTVYLEADGKAGRSAAESGVAGVQVSNGRDIVRTDAQGRYELSVSPGQTVFVIKPQGHEFAQVSASVPAFWRHYLPEGSPKLRFGGIGKHAGADQPWDFALKKSAEADQFEVLVFTDPQVKNAADVSYYAHDIVASARGHGGLGEATRFGLTLGDLVNDDLSLYPALNAATARLPVPWFHIPGNHDLDFDAATDEQSLLTWRNTYGPDTYAVEEGGASFVLLDDVIYLPGSKPAYVGGLREDQLEFLGNYLRSLPRDRLLVVGLHIPLFNDTPGVETFRAADRQRLFRMLEEFPRRLVLSGHSHRQGHWYHAAAEGWRGAPALHEYNVGAACGAFWSGVADAQGIPDATMSDGTPNGYASMKVFADGRYALDWHVARDPANPGIGIHAPRVLRQGAYPAWGVYANVYLGSDQSVVEYRIDEGTWKPMRRVDRADPWLLAENLRDDQADELRGFDRSPEAVPSSHLWRGALPTDLPPGEHRVQVRATPGPWHEGAPLHAETRYRLQEQAVPGPVSGDEAAETLQPLKQLWSLPESPYLWIAGTSG